MGIPVETPDYNLALQIKLRKQTRLGVTKQKIDVVLHISRAKAQHRPHEPMESLCLDITNKRPEGDVQMTTGSQVAIIDTINMR